jgi:hypothetical protein
MQEPSSSPGTWFGTLKPSPIPNFFPSSTKFFCWGVSGTSFSSSSQVKPALVFSSGGDLVLAPVAPLPRPRAPSFGIVAEGYGTGRGTAAIDGAREQ